MYDNCNIYNFHKKYLVYYISRVFCFTFIQCSVSTQLRAEMLTFPTSHRKSVVLKIFSDVPFCHEILSTNMTVPNQSMWKRQGNALSNVWKVFQCKVKTRGHLQYKSHNFFCFQLKISTFSTCFTKSKT